MSEPTQQPDQTPEETPAAQPPAEQPAPAPERTSPPAERSDLELRALQARIADLEAQRDQQTPPAQAAEDATAAFEGWPKPGYDGPQPWEVAQLVAQDRHRRDQSPDPYDGPGAVTHNEPLLTEGAAGEPVLRLAGLLRVLGYRDNTIARGENPAAVLDQSVMHDVIAFARAHNVTEDISAFRGLSVPAEDAMARVVGPYIWQALYEAADRAAQEATA